MRPPTTSWEKLCWLQEAPGKPSLGWLSPQPWGSPPSSQQAWSQLGALTRQPGSSWGQGPPLPLQVPAGRRPTPQPAAWNVVASGPPLPWAQPACNKRLIRKEAEGTSRNRSTAAGEGVRIPGGCPASPSGPADRPRPLPRTPSPHPSRRPAGKEHRSPLWLAHGGQGSVASGPGDRVKEAPVLPASSSVVHDLGRGRAGANLQLAPKLEPQKFCRPGRSRAVGGPQAP